MAAFLRFLLGLFLLPVCWAVTVVLLGVLASCGLTQSALSFLGGVAAFAACWLLLSHPVRTYVLGHELTHALWGLLFGAVPSRLRVGEKGGSVNLTKDNFLITLAPYFFPFYTFIVLLVAFIVRCFVQPLPWLPLWVFLVGFTWAFHVLFTIQSLFQTQPDVMQYGRLFSWTFIYVANILLIAFGLALATGYGCVGLCRELAHSVAAVYVSCGRGAQSLVARVTPT